MTQICKHCGEKIQLYGSGDTLVHDPMQQDAHKYHVWELWADLTEGRWVVCNPYWHDEGVQRVYHKPLRASKDEIIADLQRIVSDL